MNHSVVGCKQFVYIPYDRERQVEWMIEGGESVLSQVSLAVTTDIGCCAYSVSLLSIGHALNNHDNGWDIYFFLLIAQLKPQFCRLKKKKKNKWNKKY